MKQRILSVLLALLIVLPLSFAAAEETQKGTYVLISVRDVGDIYAELYPDVAPITVENFLRLADEHFYDGLTFHRIISGFMVQGGDPLGNGTGGSSQNIKGEFSQNGVDNPLLHERGVLSMARSQNPDSASSQFFIMHQAASHLDGSYAAFGKVLCGLWVVDVLCADTPVSDNNGTVLRDDQPVIETVRRAEWAEAEAAIRAEAENGLSGTVYHDFLSPVTFPVPEGWNRVSAAGETVRFVPDGQSDKMLAMVSQNLWAPLSASYKQQMTAAGLTPDTLDTDALDRAYLINNLTGDAEAVTEEEHGGVKFLTAQTADGSQTRFIGAQNGYVYLFVFTGSREDPLFDAVTVLLDQIAFD